MLGTIITVTSTDQQSTGEDEQIITLQMLLNRHEHFVVSGIFTEGSREFLAIGKAMKEDLVDPVHGTCKLSHEASSCNLTDALKLGLLKVFKFFTIAWPN